MVKLAASSILQEIELSDEQKPAVTASGDVAVTAGAGAGKTRTLVARYLSLLAEGLSPRQVAAITFTKKAAREMRNRVRNEVSDYLSQGEELAPGWYARIDTSMGRIVVQLLPEQAPQAVAQFVALARGEVEAKGAFPQERCIDPPRFLEELAARELAVRIEEREEE